MNTLSPPPTSQKLFLISLFCLILLFISPQSVNAQPPASCLSSWEFGRCGNGNFIGDTYKHSSGALHGITTIPFCSGEMITFCVSFCGEPGQKINVDFVEWDDCEHSTCDPGSYHVLSHTQVTLPLSKCSTVSFSICAPQHNGKCFSVNLGVDNNPNCNVNPCFEGARFKFVPATPPCVSQPPCDSQN